MRKYLSRLSILALLTVSAQSAFGAATLRFVYNAGAPTDCADGDGCDFNGAAGAVTVINSIGNFINNVTTGLSAPLQGPGQIDLNSVNVVTSTGGTLDIYWSQTDFGASTVGPYQLAFGGTITAGGTVTATAYYDEGNTLFGMANQIATLGPFSPVAFSGTTTGAGPGAAPYSLTQHLRLVFTGAGSFSGDFQLTPVPEPDAVALAIGVALLGVAGLRRKMA